MTPETQAQLTINQQKLTRTNDQLAKLLAEQRRLLDGETPGYRAKDVLRKPGDVARRESDGAVAHWTWCKDRTPVEVTHRTGCTCYPPEGIPGDDWQPLTPVPPPTPHHTAVEQSDVPEPVGDRVRHAPLVLLRIKAGYGLREFAERVGIAPSRYCEIETGKSRASDMEQCQILVGLGGQEQASWRRLAEQRREAIQVGLMSLYEQQAEVAELTAEVERLRGEGGLASLAECGEAAASELKELSGLRAAAERDSRVIAALVAQNGGRILARNWDSLPEGFQPYSIKVTDYGYEVATTAPLPDEPAPTAEDSGGDDRDPMEGFAEVLAIVKGWPAWKQNLLRNSGRPNNPAPRPVVAPGSTAEDSGRDETPEKPACLEGAPAVLCEDDIERKWWCFGLAAGRVQGFMECDGHSKWSSIKAAELTPIYHDPDDSAAAALEAEIEEGGKPC